MNLGIEGIDAAEEVGSGGNGIVYRATQTDLDRTVAVKMVHITADEDNLRRFQRERRVMAKMPVHTGIAPIFSSGVNEHGAPYLVMPYYESGSLQDRVKAGPIPWQEAVEAIIKTGEALVHAHSFNVLHLDLKPDNIMLDHAGLPVLVDFGISRLTDGDAGMSRALQLTPAFAAPEAFAGARFDVRTDVYSLAATLHSLIAGSPPFYTEEGLLAMSMKVVSEPPANLRHLAPDVVCACIERAMAKEPDDRPQTARDFIDELDTALRAGSSWKPAIQTHIARAKPEPLSAQAPPQPSGPPPNPPGSLQNVVPTPSPQPPLPEPKHQHGQPPMPSPVASQPVHPPMPAQPPTPSVEAYPQGQTVANPPPMYQPPQPSMPSSSLPLANQAPTAPPGLANLGPTPHAPPVPQNLGGSAGGGFGGPPQPLNGAIDTGGNGQGAGAPPKTSTWPLIAIGVVVLAALGGIAALTLPGGGSSDDDDPDVQALVDSNSDISNPGSVTVAPDISTPDSITVTTQGTTTFTTPAAAADIRTVEMRTGQCVDLPWEGGQEINFVTPVDCSEPHDSELAGFTSHPDAGGEFPGIDSLSELGLANCTQVILDYINEPALPPDIRNDAVLYPSEEEWVDDQFYSVFCFIVQTDFSDTTTSRRG